MEMGDLENAFKHLQQAVRSDPDNSTLRAEYKLVTFCPILFWLIALHYHFLGIGQID